MSIKNLFCLILLFNMVVVFSKLFSPQGTLEHLRFARRAADNGSPLVAMQFEDGIGLVTAKSKAFSKLQLSGPEQLFRVDENICIACTGLLFDAHQFVKLAQSLCKKLLICCQLFLRILICYCIQVRGIEINSPLQYPSVY